MYGDMQKYFKGVKIFCANSAPFLRRTVRISQRDRRHTCALQATVVTRHGSGGSRSASTGGSDVMMDSRK